MLCLLDHFILATGQRSYAVRHAAQSLLCHALQKTQKSLPFGSTVLEGQEPPLTLRQEKQYLYFGHPFPLYARAFFPVVRRFFWRIPTEQVLYYRNSGLYYGLASTTLPLYAKPRAKVKGGCLSCDSGSSSAWTSRCEIP